MRDRRSNARRWVARLVIVGGWAAASLVLLAGAARANDTCRPSNKGDCQNTAGVIATAATAATVIAVVTALLGGNGEKPHSPEDCETGLRMLDVEIDSALTTARGVYDQRGQKAAEHDQSVAKLNALQQQRQSESGAGILGGIDAKIQAEQSNLQAIDAYIARVDDNLTQWRSHLEEIWQKRQDVWARCNAAFPGRFPSRAKPEIERPRPLTPIPVGTDAVSDQDQCTAGIQALDVQLDAMIQQMQARVNARNQLIQTKLAMAPIPGMDQDLQARAAELVSLRSAVMEIYGRRDGLYVACDKKHPGKFWKRPEPQFMMYEGADSAGGDVVGVIGHPTSPAPGAPPAPPTPASPTGSFTGTPGESGALPGAAGSTPAPPAPATTSPPAPGTIPPAPSPPGSTPAAPPADQPGGVPEKLPPQPQAPQTTDQPPVDKPPVDKPPGDQPPTPPSDKPPGDQPPAPPGDKPPGDQPPTDKPPGDKPPGDKPPGDKPPEKKPEPVDVPAAAHPPESKPAGDQPTGQEPTPPKGGLVDQVRSKLTGPDGGTATITPNDMGQEINRIIKTVDTSKMPGTVKKLVDGISADKVAAGQDGDNTLVGVRVSGSGPLGTRLPLGDFGASFSVNKGRLTGAVTEVPESVKLTTDAAAMLDSKGKFKAVTEESATADLNKQLNKFNDDLARKGLEVKSLTVKDGSLTIVTGKK